MDKETAFKLSKKIESFPSFSEILSYSKSSEYVDAVSASGNDASDTRIDLSDAAMLCTACPISCASVKTSRDFPV